MKAWIASWSESCKRSASIMGMRSACIHDVSMSHFTSCFINLCLEFCNSGIHHQHHQIDKEGGVVSDNIVCLAAHVHKSMKLWRHFVTTIDDIGHVWRQHKWDTITRDGSNLLCIVQKTSKVHVEQMSGCCDKQIVVVSVADAEEICCNTVSSTL